jgi:hypothetical protein
LSSVVYESIKEVALHSSGVSSTAISSKIDKNVNFPNIVICRDNGYKGDELAMTKDQYIDSTYSFEDMFFNATFLADMTDVLGVKTVYSRYKGRFEIPRLIRTH